MTDRYHVIRRALVTERGTRLREQHNQYLFEVDPGASKGEIREAVEALFKVDVTGVRTSRVPGKWRRVGRYLGQRSGWKKAIVSVKSGQTIAVAAEA